MTDASGNGRRPAVFDYDQFPSDSVRILVGPHHFNRPSFAVHRHTYGELVIVTGGSGTHQTPNVDYPLNAGDVFYMPPGAVHGFTASAGMSIANIAFDPGIISPGVRRSLGALPGYHSVFHLVPYRNIGSAVRSRLTLDEAHLRTLLPLLDRMERESEIRTPGYEAILLGMTLELVTRICRIFSEIVSSADEPLHRVARAASRIERDFAKPLRLKDLAAEAHLSANHLLRLFRDAYGVSPIKRLALVRLDHACELLSTTSLGISQVAEACGYPDQNYFTRAFRKETGLSPSRYRQESGPEGRRER